MAMASGNFFIIVAKDGYPVKYPVTPAIRTKALQTLCANEGLPEPELIKEAIADVEYDAVRVALNDEIGLIVVFGPVENADSFRPDVPKGTDLTELSRVFMHTMSLYMEEVIKEMINTYGPEAE
jgi:hypothetical protein